MTDQEISNELKDWLTEKLRKEFEKALAEYPWWCCFCGAGGNYEGERPDEYLWPPLDHVCEHKKPSLKGITKI